MPAQVRVKRPRAGPAPATRGARLPEGVPDWWGEQVARGEIQEQEEAMVAPLVIAAAEWAGHLAWVEAARRNGTQQHHGIPAG